MKNRRRDIMSPETRSLLMARIKGKNTKPELAVRRLLHKLGYRYRLHVRDLPGCPDIVFARKRIVIFVHGCFWHRHSCGRAYQPKTRATFWRDKFRANVSRDSKSMRELSRLGWRYLVIWECQVSKPISLASKLQRFLR